MKKQVYNILMMFFLVFMVTGCVKFNAEMDIKKNKSMDFKIIYAIDTTYFGDEELLEDNNKQELEDAGFLVTDYSDGTMKGFTISKSVKNIDDVSSMDDTEYSLSGIVGSNKKDEYIFKVKKGLFKNTYTAKLNFDSSDSSLNDSSDSEEDFDDSDLDYTSDDESDYDFSGMMGSMDLSFNVKLPYGATSNNATTVSDDGKTLRWELMSNDISTIEFEFELYNMTVIYIGIGLLIVIVVGIVIFVCKKRNKKSINSGYTNPQSLDTSSSIDMQQNISRDVYQSSLQSVQSMAESNTTYSQENESLVHENSLDLPISSGDNAMQHELHSTIDNLSVQSPIITNETSVVTEISNSVISNKETDDNSLHQPEILDIDSDQQNMN